MDRLYELELERKDLAFEMHMDQEHECWRRGLLNGLHVHRGQVYGRCLHMDQACGFGEDIDVVDSSMGHCSHSEHMIRRIGLDRCCLNISTIPCVVPITYMGHCRRDWSARPLHLQLPIQRLQHPSSYYR
jgi:hypothetical protein